MAEIPTRTCRACGHVFPLNAAHWYRERQRFRPICQPCTRARLAALKAAAKARHAAERAARAVPPPKPKRHWVPNPTGKGLDPAMHAVGHPPHFKAPPKHAPTLRDALLAEATPRLRDLACTMVARALAGDPAMLRYLGGLLLELDGPEDPLAEALRELSECGPAEPEPGRDG